MIFKNGDTVYHYKYGKGVIVKDTRLWNLEVQFDCIPFVQAIPSELLSFTPYTLEGFTQERPHEYKKGDLVLCCIKKDTPNKDWFIRFYSHTDNHGKIMVSVYLSLQDPNWVNYIKPYDYV